MEDNSYFLKINRYNVTEQRLLQRNKQKKVAKVAMKSENFKKHILEEELVGYTPELDVRCMRM